MQDKREPARIVIRADKCPKVQHKGRFNYPTAREVAVIIPNQQTGSKDIVLKMRSSYSE